MEWEGMNRRRKLSSRLIGNGVLTSGETRHCTEFDFGEDYRPVHSLLDRRPPSRVGRRWKGKNLHEPGTRSLPVAPVLRAAGIFFLTGLLLTGRFLRLLPRKARSSRRAILDDLRVR